MPSTPLLPSPSAPPQRRPRGEWNPSRVAAVLLFAGALLILAAAVAFTRVSWAHLGVAGRSTLLVVLTGLLTASVVPLAHRRLLVTADAVGTLSVLLGLLDTVLLHRWLNPGAPLGPAVGSVAVGLALVALAIAARLDLPAVGCTGVLVAQIVLPALAAPGVRAPGSVCIVLGSVALLDAALLAGLPSAASLLSGRVRRALTVATTVTLSVTATLTLLVSAMTSVLASGGAAPAGVALLLVAGGLALVAATHDRPAVTALAVVVGGTAAAAAGARTMPTVGPALALVALLATVLATRGLPRRHQVAAATSALVLAVAAALAELPALTLGLALPVLIASGHAAGPDLPFAALHDGTLLPVLGLLAAAGALAGLTGRLRGTGPVLLGDSVAVLPAALPALALVLALPGVLGLPAPAAAGVLAVVVLLLGARALGTHRGAVAALLTLPAGLHAVATTGDGSPARVVVEGLLLLVAGAAAAVALDAEARYDVTAGDETPDQARGTGIGPLPVVVPVVVAVLLAVAVAGTVALVAGASAALSGVIAALVAVAVLATIAAGDRLGLGALATGPVAAAAEAAAAVGTLVAVRAPLADHSLLPAALGVAGLALVSGHVRRPEPLGRLMALSGQVVLLLAWAVQLDQTHVTLVEAWSLPLAVVLLAQGQLARRRASSLPSEVLLPGLLVALVPSLLVELDHPALVRSLAVLAAGVAVLLAGVLGRLRAPMLVGGGVLALLAGRQIAPLAVALPRDLVLALAGVLLLGLGATYERRHADLRRLAVRVRTLG